MITLILILKLVFFKFKECNMYSMSNKYANFESPMIKTSLKGSEKFLSYLVVSSYMIFTSSQY